MVYRIFVEKKKELANEAKALYSDATALLGIAGLKEVRVFNRYDAENISKEIFDYAVGTVFSEPQVDIATDAPEFGDAAVFAVEFLPGQFDQRADSAAQCIQLIAQGERPLVRSAKVYALYGSLTEAETAEIKKYVINPVEAREASLERPETLRTEYEIPTEVPTLTGFRSLSRPGYPGGPFCHDGSRSSPSSRARRSRTSSARMGAGRRTLRASISGSNRHTAFQSHQAQGRRPSRSTGDAAQLPPRIPLRCSRAMSSARRVRRWKSSWVAAAALW